LERNLGTVWIGLSKKPYSTLKFTNHSVPRFTYWGAGQPNRQFDQRTCVMANVTGYHVGRWDDVDCETKNPYICEIYHGKFLFQPFFSTSKLSTDYLCTKKKKIKMYVFS
jgi:hypothetical protein